MTQQSELMSLSVLQHSANRFIRLAQVTSGRLAQHRANLAGLRAAQGGGGDPSGGGGQLNRELVNASRCVGQLKCRLQELRQLQDHVRPEERPAFDRLVGPTVATVTEEIRDFTQAYIDATVSLDVDGVAALEAAAPFGAQSQPPPPTPAQVASYVFDDSPSLPASTPALALEEATASLARDLADLEELMAQLSATVSRQGQGVASVEESVTRAEADTEKGVRWLRQAVRYRAYYLPVAGAATGALLGGPVGLLIGLKAGAAAGLLGGVAGFASGRLLTWGSSGSPAPVAAGDSMEMSQLVTAETPPPPPHPVNGDRTSKS